MPTVSVARGFGVSAAILFVVACLFGSFSDTALDIPIHDTYFVIAFGHWYLAIALLLGAFALLYVLLERVFKLKLARSLALTHFAFTLPLMLYLCVLVLDPRLFNPTPKRYYSYSEFEPSLALFGIGIPLAIVVILFVIGQLALLIAILRAVFRIRR